MKKNSFLFFMALYFSSQVALAAEEIRNYVYSKNQNEQIAEEQDYQDVQGADDYYNELIYEEYGSNLSPSFNNREDINPNESVYGFGSSGGEY